MMRLYTERQSKLEAINQTLAGLPKGSLYPVKRGEHRYFYHEFYEEGRRVQRYVRKKDVEELRKQLGIRRALTAQRRELIPELKRLRSFLRRMGVDAAKAYREKDEWLETRRREREAVEKKKAFSSQDPYGYDNKKNITVSGEAVRSKSEVLIANLLKQNHIDYTYEKTLLLDGETVSPDFTIAGRKGAVYWEHCGMMEDAAYRARWNRKREIYEKNGIREGLNLIVSYEQRDGGIDTEQIQRLIETYLL